MSSIILFSNKTITKLFIILKYGLFIINIFYLLNKDTPVNLIRRQPFKSRLNEENEEEHQKARKTKRDVTTPSTAGEVRGAGRRPPKKIRETLRKNTK